MKKRLIITTLLIAAIAALSGTGVALKGKIVSTTETLIPTTATPTATAPTPTQAQPTTTTVTSPTSDPAPTAPTPTTIYSDSSDNHAPGAVVVTDTITSPTDWNVNFSYSCDGASGVIAAFHSLTGASFGFDNHGSSYTRTIGPISAASGTFRITPPSGETCTWTLSATN